jgi:membrane-bound serine protease (ClpP class)
MATTSRARSRPFWTGILLIGASVAAVGVTNGTSQDRTGQPRQGVVYRVPVTGVIELGLAPFIARSLDEARQAKATAVVLHMDTPGGRVDAAEDIVDAIQDSEIPVYTFVDRRAFSAGALIALSTRGIWMRPGAVIGAATPIDGSGEKAPEKIVSAMRSQMRALAEERGLDPRVAEAMVDEDIAIEGVVDAGKLLTLTTEESVRLGYAQEVEDWDAMLAAIGANGAEVYDARTNWAEAFVRFLSHPAVAPLLLSLGMLGLIVEFKTPTFGLAGAAGLTMLALFFGSRWIVGLAGLEEIMLLGAGLILLGVEIFVLPGFGIAGILGIGAVGSSMFLSLVPSMPVASDFGNAAGVLSLVGIIVVLIGWALLRHLPRSGRFARSGLLLEDSTSRAGGYNSSTVRAELVGASGVALTDLRPSGVVRIGDERLDVVAESEWIRAGTPVRVVSAEGYRHVVRTAD